MSLRHTTNGKYMTRSLFEDVDRHDNLSPPFFLSQKPKGDSRKCFRELFLFYEDETGYKVAVETLGSYDHWENLMKLDWFQEEVDRWKLELRQRLRDRAFQKILTLVEDRETPAATAIAAAKWVVDKMDKETSPKKRGRPSKVEIEGNVKRAIKEDQDTLDDLERISSVN